MHICHRGSEEDRIVDKCNMGTKTGKKNGDVSDLDGEEEGDRGALERELPGLACYHPKML